MLASITGLARTLSEWQYTADLNRSGQRRLGKLLAPTMQGISSILWQAAPDGVIAQGFSSNWEPEAWLLVGGAVVSVAVTIFAWRLLRHALAEESDQRRSGG